jgi:hypothetical protein
MLRRERTMLVSAVITIAAACSAGTTTMHVSYGPDIVIGVPPAASGNLADEGAMAKQGYDLWLDWSTAPGAASMWPACATACASCTRTTGPGSTWTASWPSG